MTNIYILKLEQDKYYVGKSNNPNIKTEQYFVKNELKWTQKYKPLSIIEIINNCDDSDEHKYTLKYMEIYGINNVRGGLFCNIKLTTSNIDTIIKMLNCTMDRCYICCANNHLTNNCMNNLVVINDINKKIDKLCNCPSSLLKKLYALGFLIIKCLV